MVWSPVLGGIDGGVAKRTALADCRVEWPGGVGRVAGRRGLACRKGNVGQCGRAVCSRLGRKCLFLHRVSNFRNAG